jgi:hypothetical protein
MNLVPISGYFFKGSFMQMLKREHGRIFSEVNLEYRKRIIEICVYST